jgi:hypothetical protein
MSIDDIIFGRHPGEADDAYASRVDEIQRAFRNVLASLEGHKLIALLTQAVNPIKPRFGAGVSPEMAAFRDGQADVIATLLTRGTNLGMSKPDNYHNQP